MTDYKLRLVLTPEATGITTAADAYNVMCSCVMNDKWGQCYSFFGCHGEAQSYSSDLIEVDGKYYEKTPFTVVPGYEKVRFEDAVDKSLYHPSTVNIAPGSSTADDDTSGTKEKLVTIYTDESGVEKTKNWVPKDSVSPNPSNSYTFKAIDKHSFVLYTGYSDELACYTFAFQELTGGMEYPWTYENRFNMFVAEYTSDYKKAPNDYKLYAVSDEINGEFPGTPMKSN